MNYVEKEYEEIFGIMLEDSVSKGLVSKAEDFESFIENKDDISNYYIMDKSVIAYMFRIVYAEGITPVYNSKDIDLATGDDLDDIGKQLGIPRPGDTFASVEATFSIEELSENEIISLEAGITVSTENGIEYVTVEPLYISENNMSTTVQCLSVNPGTSSRISPNSLVNIVDNVSYNLSVTNLKSSTGGTDEYNDTDYRDLLLNWRKILIKGSDEAYEEFFANFDGIDGYKLIPNWDGTGTMKIILDPGTSYLLNQAYEQVQSQVTQSTEDIVMFAPVDKPIDIYAVVNVNIDQINPYSELEKANIQSQIIDAIKVFIDGGYRDETWYSGLNIGEDFIPHKLAVFLDDVIPELKNITFNYPTDYIEIKDEEIGVSNNITIEMI